MQDDDIDALPEDNGADWQTTFLDTMTILLAFFVILSSQVAEIDVAFIMGKKKPEEVQEKDVPNPEEEKLLFFPIFSLASEIETALADEIAQGKLKLELGEYEIRMLFSGSSFYRLGEAQLLPVGKEIISSIIGQLIRIDRVDYKLDIEGHTDSAPINTVRFKDNWDLSAARASGIVRYFLEKGVSAEKLKASGYADTFLVEPDRDERGNYIPESQDKNRRIVIRLYFD